MLIIGGIKQLLHIEGHTIKGAKQVFREKGLNYVVGLSKPLMSQDLAGTGSDKKTITKVVKPIEKIISPPIDIVIHLFPNQFPFRSGVSINL